MILVQLALSFGCILLWYLLHRRRKPLLRHGIALPRVPSTLPLLGDSIAFAKPRQQLFDLLQTWQSHLGIRSYELVIPFMPPFAIVSDPRNIEFVLARPELFVKGVFFKKNCNDVFGDAIINADGLSWKSQRKAGVRFLTRPRVQHLIDFVLPLQYRDTIETSLWRAAEVGRTIDLQEAFHDLTTRVMGHLAFDTHVDSHSPYCEAFEYASNLMGDRFQDPLWPLTQAHRHWRTRDCLHTLRIEGRRMLLAALGRDDDAATSTAAPGEQLDRGNLATKLFQAVGGDHDKAARAMMAFLSAGKDTLYEALTWTVFEILRHPEEAARLRKLITLESSASSASLGKGSQASVLALAMLRESLRLHPPVPFEAKQCEAFVELPDGTQLPKGAIVGWSIFAMGRSRELWGEDAEAWKPSRWLLSTPTSTSTINNNASQDNTARQSIWHIYEPPPSKYPVFNGGPRACIGQAMAEAEVIWTIKKLLSEWELQPAVSLSDERCTPSGLTMPKLGGLPCRVWRR